ncbi:hypothetical protein FB567DRAFT_619059 [Paraphoma chrysanthemicola]|uniref:Uncharacterized protein n=1 Tax=Paraphoma chrysanthemicola TaxID=798071 RepID=A0A8K0W0C5_9PLEO|nr:hypothetical protein FB567DRAFT_619059 [Paraphoma chrysanthemicola]
MIIPIYLIDTRESEPIAKGKSHPATSEANSILNLPAEIRNLVYDALFHVPGGIRLAPHDDDHYYGGRRYYFVDQLFEDDDVGDALAVGFPLLATCRQIHREAVSTLFSSNTWIIGRISMATSQNTS